MKYQPNEGSLACKVVHFFAASPDEMLSRDDIAEKFEDATPNTVHTRLIEAKEAGVIERTRNDDGEYIYKAGTNIHLFAPTMPITREAIKAGIKEIKVDVNVPIPRNRECRNHSVWMPVLSALKQKGHSVVVDKKEIGNLLTLIARMQYKGASNQPKYVAGIDGRGHARVWRAA
jgi:hypothetical protein